MRKFLILFTCFCFSFMTIIPMQLFAGVTAKKIYSQEQLDQMLAPVALYPDSLLSQILMASTYPSQVSQAVQWSASHSDVKGDDAVSAVQDKAWDPSVMSLVAFPDILKMMGEKSSWVSDLGDAFLAEPENVMDSVQNLRKKAKEQGNLKTTKEQTVKVDSTSSSQTIIIEPADPKVVYVPVYNPTVVYGTWWYPGYPPFYYYPPHYHFGSAIVAGIGFGIGIAITNSLWGGFHWGRHDVNINVNRYNNINVNKRLNVNKNTVNWKHNNRNRGGTPYRDKNNRQQFDQKLGNSKERQSFKGRDNITASDRAKAQNVLKDHGIDVSKERQQLSGKKGNDVRKRVDAIDRSKLNKNNYNQGSLSNRSNSSRNSARNSNALSGIQNKQKTSRNIQRGNRSFNSRGGNRGGGGFRGRR